MKTKNKVNEKKFQLTGQLTFHDLQKFGLVEKIINQEIIARNKSEAVKKSKEFIKEELKNYPITINRECSSEFHEMKLSLCLVEKIWEGSIKAYNAPRKPYQDRRIKIKISEKNF